MRQISQAELSALKKKGVRITPKQKKIIEESAKPDNNQHIAELNRLINSLSTALLSNQTDNQQILQLFTQVIESNNRVADVLSKPANISITRGSNNLMKSIKVTR